MPSLICNSLFACAIEYRRDLVGGVICGICDPLPKNHGLEIEEHVTPVLQSGKDPFMPSVENALSPRDVIAKIRREVHGMDLVDVLPVN